MTAHDTAASIACLQGRVAVDIGSTVVKIARLDGQGGLTSQEFHPRDFEAGIATQVMTLLTQAGIDPRNELVWACSSANGGLQVGVVCLSAGFSGMTLRNQVLLAGANPVYVQSLDEAKGDSRRVDLLLVGGGIDDEDALPMRSRLARFDASRYPHGALVFCGNRYLAPEFKLRYPNATVIANPQGESLSSRAGSVFETVRRAYLDDLVFKEGVSELPPALAHVIRPTPEVASRGFLRSVMNQSSLAVVGACVALDIGGATTDLHYTVEVVADDSPVRPASGVSVARYVFTDLGVVASRDTLMLRLRNHAQLYEFLVAMLGEEVREVFAGLREGEHVPSPSLLAYGCLFMALDRFVHGDGPGLPKARLDLMAQLILTGGAAQTLDEAVVGRIVRMMLAPEAPAPLVQIDRRYEIWVAGITWEGERDDSV